MTQPYRLQNDQIEIPYLIYLGLCLFLYYIIVYTPIYISVHTTLLVNVNKGHNSISLPTFLIQKSLRQITYIHPTNSLAAWCRICK